MQPSEIFVCPTASLTLKNLFLRAPFIPLILLILTLLSSCAGLDQQNADLDRPLTMPQLTEDFFPDNAALWTDSVKHEDFCPEQTPTASDWKAPEAEWTTPESEATLEQEIVELEKLGSWDEGQAADEPTEDQKKKNFPITINRQVEYYLDFFQHKQPLVFARWLSRSGRYLPLIQKELEAADLPAELSFLPLIESGFNLTAYSRARAVGPWQFMKATGTHYGLTIDQYVDERRDIVASTRSAILFLNELYDEFGSWYLAVAGYNAGAGSIRKAIRRTGTTNFWKLAQSRYLHAETKLYVPKLIAAILIAKDPAAYGFADIDYLDPLRYEEVDVPPWTALPAVAIAGDIDREELMLLNMELRKSITPPYEPYTLKVPVGKGKLVADNLERVKAVVRTTYKNHTVTSGETIRQVCRQHNLNTITLLKANNLRKSKLVAGQRLRIPVQTTEYRLLAANEQVGDNIANSDGLLLHEIKPGESLSTISRKYGVSTEQLAAWNDIKDPHRIRAGSRLALYLENPLIDTGDNDTEMLTETGKEKPEPGRAAQETHPFGKITYYSVKRGDSLWKIAHKFQLTTEQIRQWNNLESDTIKPGHRLLLRLEQDEDA